MSKTSPAEFVRQVKQETLKVTWPSRKETAISTVMVLVMVVISALFFMFVDWVISTGIQAFLGLAS